MSEPTGDNRLYDYSSGSWYVRDEFSIICNWVKEGSNIIDLGAGNGSLLHYIRERKNVESIGIESEKSGVEFGRDNGIDLAEGTIDTSNTYEQFSDKQFDYAICNVTLQMVLYPEVVMKEMKRIATFQIFSFPNFAYIGNRLDLLYRGRMPRPMLHGYTWYNTGHIHQLSVKDFMQECKRLQLDIVETTHLGCFRKLAIHSGNAFSKESIFMTKATCI